MALADLAMDAAPTALRKLAAAVAKGELTVAAAKVAAAANYLTNLTMAVAQTAAAVLRPACLTTQTLP